MFTSTVYGSLYEKLVSHGDLIELNFDIPFAQFKNEITAFNNDWKIYNSHKPNARYGLPLTSLSGGMDGTEDLTAIHEYNKRFGTSYNELSFQTPTAAYHGLTSLHPLLEHFSPLGRTHLLRLDRGGFFPPHRDEFTMNDPAVFRIIVPIMRCNISDLVLLFEDERVILTPGRPYFMNTFKSHAAFSFVDGCIMMVMNIPFTEENVAKMFSKFAQR